MAEIVAIHLESDLSEFTTTVTDSGDLSWSNDATAQAVAGTAGAMKLVIDDTNVIYGRKAVTKVARTRYRFYIDPNTLTMANGNAFHSVRLSNTNGDVMSNIELQYETGVGYQLVCTCLNDADGAVLFDTCNITDAPHYVEIDNIRATDATSNDGSYQWWVDGVSQGSVASVDNYNRMFDLNWLLWAGAISGIDAGTSGTFYIDEIVANDDGSEIGPVGGNTYEDALSLSKQGTLTLSSIATIESSFPLIKNTSIDLSGSVVFEAALSLARNLSILLDKTSAYAIEDVILEWTTQVLNTYNEAFSLSKAESVSLSSIITSESSLSLNRQLAISLLTNIVQSVTADLSKSLNFSLSAEAEYLDTLSLSKQLAIVLSDIKSIEASLALNKQLSVTELSDALYLLSLSLSRTNDISISSSVVYETSISLAKLILLLINGGADYYDVLSLENQRDIISLVSTTVNENISLGKQLSLSSSAYALYLASISLAKTLDLSLVSSATYETVVSLIRDLALVLDATVTGSAQTYEEAFALSKSLSVTKSTLLDAIEALTLARALAISVSASMISSESFTLDKQLSISLLSGLLLDSALSLIRDEALTVSTTLTLNENIGLIERHNISDSALAEIAGQLSLGKSVSISATATLTLEEDVTLGRVLAIQISGGKVFDDAFVLSILQAIATASDVILFVGQIPAKLVINDQSIWLVSIQDTLVSDDIIETDISQSDIIIEDTDHV